MGYGELAVVLAVDGSASVTYDEFGLIADGMAVALRDPAVVAGLVGMSVLNNIPWVYRPAFHLYAYASGGKNRKAGCSGIE